MHLMTRLRQLLFPPAFRIEPPGPAEWAEALVEALGTALQEARTLQEKVTASIADAPGPEPKAEPGKDDPPLPAPPADGGVINTDFIVSLCNDYFRLKRNIEGMKAKHGDIRELGRIERILESVQFLLGENKIECLDLADQDYDAGRKDFDPIGPPEEMPGLVRPKIMRCERPLIRLNGKIIQKSRGLVAKPARAS